MTNLSEKTYATVKGLDAALTPPRVVIGWASPEALLMEKLKEAGGGVDGGLSVRLLAASGEGDACV